MQTDTSDRRAGFGRRFPGIVLSAGKGLNRPSDDAAADAARPHRKPAG
jgi:hypothetical protein